MADFVTEGERLFARYLDEELGLREGADWLYEPEIPGRAKRIDFAITTTTLRVLIDSKDFAPPTQEDIEAEVASGARFFDPSDGIRRKIDQVRRQLRPFAGRYPCGVVIRAGYLPEQSFALSQPREVFAAMPGDLSVELPIRSADGAAPLRAGEVFSNGGKMFAPGTRRPRNTSVGAILTLRSVSPIDEATRVLLEAGELGGAYSRMRTREQFPINEWIGRVLESMGLASREPRLAVRVHVSPLARAPRRVPFPSSVFCGPYDEVWKYDVASQRDPPVLRRCGHCAR